MLKSEHGIFLLFNRYFGYDSESIFPDYVRIDCGYFSVEINVPDTMLGNAISLFNARGGKVEDLEDRAGMKNIRGLAPLSALFGFSTDLRSATQGRAGLVSRFERFDRIS